MDDVEQNATEFVKMHVRNPFSSDSLASSGRVDIRFEERVPEIVGPRQS
jgi:hypothetical protein